MNYWGHNFTIFVPTLKLNYPSEAPCHLLFRDDTLFWGGKWEERAEQS